MRLSVAMLQQQPNLYKVALAMVRKSKKRVVVLLFIGAVTAGRVARFGV